MMKLYLLVFAILMVSNDSFGASPEEYEKEVALIKNALSQKPPAFDVAAKSLDSIEEWWAEDQDGGGVFKRGIARAVGAGAYIEGTDPIAFLHTFILTNKQFIADMRAGKISQPSPPPPPLPPTKPAGVQQNFGSYQNNLKEAHEQAIKLIAQNKRGDALNTLQVAYDQFLEALKLPLDSAQKKELILLLLTPLQMLDASDFTVPKPMLAHLTEELASVEQKKSPPSPPVPPAPAVPPAKLKTVIEYENALDALKKKAEAFIAAGQDTQAFEMLQQENRLLVDALALPLLDPDRKSALIQLVLEPASVLNALDATKYGTLFNELQVKKTSANEEVATLRAAVEEKEKKDLLAQEEERKAAIERETKTLQEEARQLLMAAAYKKQQRQQEIAREKLVFDKALNSTDADKKVFVAMVKRLNKEQEESAKKIANLHRDLKNAENKAKAATVGMEDALKPIAITEDDIVEVLKGDALTQKVIKRLIQQRHKAEKDSAVALQALHKNHDREIRVLSKLKQDLQSLQTINNLNLLKAGLKTVSDNILSGKK